jgi:hypothetical protein
MSDADRRRALRDLEDDLATALAALEGATLRAVEDLEDTRDDVITEDDEGKVTGIDQSELKELYEQITYGVPGEIEAAHRRFAQDLARLLRGFKRALTAMETQGAPQ